MRQELELLLTEHLRSFRYRDMGAVASAASGLAVRWSLVSWIYMGGCCMQALVAPSRVECHPRHVSSLAEGL